eukprot:485942_1
MGCLCSKSENESELANDDVIVTIHDEPYNVKPTGAILDMLPDMPPIAQNIFWALLVGLVMIVSIFILPALFRSGNGQQTNTVPIGSDYGQPIFKPELAPKTSDTIQFEYVKAQLEDHLSAEKEKANENTQANESETTHLSNKTPTIKSDDTVSGGSNGSQSTTPKQTVPKQSDSINRSHKTSEIKSDDTQADSDAIIFDDFSGSNGSQGTSPKHTVAKQSCSISGSYKTSEIQSGDTQADSESIIFNCFGDSNDSQGTSPKPVAEQSGDDANSNLIGTAAKVQNDDDLPSANNNDETFTNSNELSIESQIAKTTLDSNNSDQDIINSLPIEGTGGGPNMAASGANLGVLNSNKLKSNDDQLIQSSDKSVTLSTTGGQHANDVNGDEFEYYSDNSSEVVTSQSQPPLNTKPHGNVLARSTEPSTMSTGSHKPNDDNIPRSVSLPNIEPGDRYSLPTNLPSNELHSVPKTLAKQTSSSNIEFANDTMSDCEIPKAQSSHLNPVYASTLTGLGSISMQNTNKFTGSDGHGQSDNEANTDGSNSPADQTSDQSTLIISTLISPIYADSNNNASTQSDILTAAQTNSAVTMPTTEGAAINSFANSGIGHFTEQDTKQDTKQDTEQVTEHDTKQVTMSPISNYALSRIPQSTDFTNAPPQSGVLSSAQTTKQDILFNEQLLAKEVLKEVIESVATTATEPESKPSTKQVMKTEVKQESKPVTNPATG